MGCWLAEKRYFESRCLRKRQNVYCNAGHRSTVAHTKSPVLIGWSCLECTVVKHDRSTTSFYCDGRRLHGPCISVPRRNAQTRLSRIFTRAETILFSGESQAKGGHPTPHPSPHPKEKSFSLLHDVSLLQDCSAIMSSPVIYKDSPLGEYLEGIFFLCVRR